MPMGTFLTGILLGSELWELLIFRRREFLRWISFLLFTACSARTAFVIHLGGLRLLGKALTFFLLPVPSSHSCGVWEGSRRWSLVTLRAATIAFSGAAAKERVKGFVALPLLCFSYPIFFGATSPRSAGVNKMIPALYLRAENSTWSRVVCQGSSLAMLGQRTCVTTFPADPWKTTPRAQATGQKGIPEQLHCNPRQFIN